jgi:hypothetical protein
MFYIFLTSISFETPVEARERAAAEGNARAEDVVPIYRKRTHIDPSGAERVTQARYFVVDGVEALAKFGNDAWDRVVAVLTTGQAWQFKPYKWSEPRTLFHHGKPSIQLFCFSDPLYASRYVVQKAATIHDCWDPVVSLVLVHLYSPTPMQLVILP